MTKAMESGEPAGKRGNEGLSGAADLARRLTGGRRLLVASNRGPVEHYFDGDGGVREKAGSGGVAVTLSAIARHTPVTWVAAALTDADRAAARNGHGNGSSPKRLQLRLVAPDSGTYDRSYNLICNPILWLLQHGQWGLLDWHRSMEEIREGFEAGYQPVNRAFADRVLHELSHEENAPVVMFHDYQLYTAPMWVRDRAPQAVLSHFVHIPWPPMDAWQQLPWEMTRTILAGLLACDLVGLQTPESAHNFLLTCMDFIREARVDFDDDAVVLDGHRTRVRHYPIAPDLTSLQNRMRSPSVRHYKERLSASPCPYTIVRVDRMDPVKNILAGFRAYDLLLEANPSLVGQVRFLAFLVPCRQQVPEYRSYAKAVLGLVNKINRRWATPDWQPIELFYEHNYDQALAGLASYDVLLVNSLADGLNLVSKEGAYVNDRDGVLVLSRAAGAFRELGPVALPVDPADVAGTARAMAVALAMSPEERRRSAALLRGAVEANDFSRWLERQLRDLQEVAHGRRIAPAGSGHRRRMQGGSQVLVAAR